MRHRRKAILVVYLVEEKARRTYYTKEDNMKEPKSWIKYFLFTLHLSRFIQTGSETFFIFAIDFILWFLLSISRLNTTSMA